VPGNAPAATGGLARPPATAPVAAVPDPNLPLPPPIVNALPMAVLSWKKDDHALFITTGGGVLRLEPFLQGVLRVSFGPADVIAHPPKSYVVLRKPETVEWDVKETPQALALTTAAWTALIDKPSGKLSIHDASGKVVLQEPDSGGRSNSPALPIRPRQVFATTPDEGLYGLGEIGGPLNRAQGYKTNPVAIEMIQVNTKASVPVLLSTDGYSIYWDNPSRTLFNVVNGTYSFTSDFGKLVDYYVMIGPKFDDLVAHYRDLTGQAPMFPKWALGFHQSRNRYRTQDEILATLHRLRDEKIPVDSIFLDYLYWDRQVGSMTFNRKMFPDPKGMVDAIHQLHGHLVISVWPAFGKGTDNYAMMEAGGYLLNGVQALHGDSYDAFNPQAGKAYWQTVAKELEPLGIDGWFLDGPEPDSPAKEFLPSTTFLGPAYEVRNLYPLFHTTNFYQGLRAARPNQRNYIITRCAFAGQQRNATTVWSGDIGTSYGVLKGQIALALNFVATGIPYWTSDIGGYLTGDPADPVFEESYTRWWQFGTFCPIYRTHGRRQGTHENELWAFGPQTQKICTQYDDLRYRLMPYIYSLTGRVTLESYTPMRLLPFDFPDDLKVRNLGDEFMYGPAFLVSPVVEANAINRVVYLPAGTSWTDFWSGQVQQGGQEITADAPIEKIPLFIRAGSIIPMGPFLQYSDEKPADPIELRVYPGADGEFKLYEDDGITYGYEKGQFSTITFTWDEKAQTLKIGARQGSFPGMLASRTFNVVFVDATHGTGIALAEGGKSVTYTGSELAIKKP
jgi:alpha-D-xyloside xylohydrolase